MRLGPLQRPHNKIEEKKNQLVLKGEWKSCFFFDCWIEAVMRQKYWEVTQDLQWN